MKTNAKNQLVLEATAEARAAKRCTSNMICVIGELRKPIENIKARTGMNTRQLVNTLLEYALANVEVVEDEE